MKTRHFFTALALMGTLVSCTIDELELTTNQIDIEKLEISEHKNSEEPQDTTSDRNGG